MRVIVVGYGVQGHKRKAASGADCAAVVDPVSADADFRSIEQVPLDRYDAALLCIPDEPKIDLITYLLSNGKHVLVEKPLLAPNDARLAELERLAQANRVVCYTAYNHRFEPHFMRMRDLIASGVLGNIYGVRMFYGNGTARLVRDSAWRDTGAGVLPDLGSHLLDTLLFWFPQAREWDYRIRWAAAHENRCFDHVGIDVAKTQHSPLVQLEMTLLMWRNHFTCDVLAEKGSAHIESLCKWGPTTFVHRKRVLPSGRPPEDKVELVQADPTWAAEYVYFIALCKASGDGNLANDRWINRTLHSLAAEAGAKVLGA
ncbi:Gfo/Idh/MocA family protein [Undibacter mobilis]|uniref:Gfo/Idh/MocA family oxidoreductase n=1 Tax=Undibacter mobilis TaxID=2292256 RepID=A0A371B6M2_9BRAD|nr:Gfo/Idh/MocA family oxidoreductase [Undibacter mobilis]RDV03157.1 gfo/Idh/MocA family oxidoreductase [Undibacter mobilis]